MVGATKLTTCKLSPVRGDRVAPRYCFRAKCRVVHGAKSNVVGEFTCYDKTPDVGRDVFVACRLFAEGDPLLECTEAELVIFEHCPVECVREVIFTEYKSESTP